jgi:hypothetical protein
MWVREMNPQGLVGLIMSPFRHRDRLEQHLLALGERVDPQEVPADLRWFTWRPVTQRLYYWSWAARDGWLWGRLHDTDGPGGIWRVPISAAVRQALRAIGRHLGTGITLVAARVCLSVADA